MIIQAITNSHPLWNETVRFAENCSWQGGKYLADIMKNGRLRDWERVFIACAENRITGFCCFTEKDEISEEYDLSPFIGCIFVDEDHRGNRISEKLINEVSSYAAKVGFDSVYIMSGEVGLYEKYGFSPLGKYKTVFGGYDRLFIRPCRIDYNIRKLRENEYYILDDFLYEAIFIPEGTEAPPKEIINRPELRVYTENFGKRKGDICFAAEVGGRIAGAVWVRIMNDYGHIDDDTPSFAISLYKEYRNRGIGTALMKTTLAELKKQGYKKASLAVQKANYAVKMYKALGFETISENDEEYIMLREL